MWYWIAGGIYALVALGFLFAILTEASNREVPVAPIHFLVAILWFPWVIWYTGVSVYDWFKLRKINNAR